MFASLAEVYGADTLGVVLSGMGRDDPGRAVTEAGLASAILPPDQIALRIAASLRARSASSMGAARK
jgi:chemotaxis response regulator CheB